MKRCALCGGRLGLISHRHGRLRFCKQVHKSAYLQRRREQQKAEGGRRMCRRPAKTATATGWQAAKSHEERFKY